MTTPQAIITHGGKFHADDVFAVAALKLIYPNATVYRCKAVKDWPKVVSPIIVDTGLEHNPSNLTYDHHQRGGAGMHVRTQVQKASFGLVWDAYGAHILKAVGSLDSVAMLHKIEDTLVSSIDAVDTGTFPTVVFGPDPENQIPMFGLSSTISMFNTDDVNHASAQDAAFQEATQLATRVLKAVITSANESETARLMFKSHYDGVSEVAVFSSHIPGWGSAARDYPNLKFVVFPRDEKFWTGLNVSGEKASDAPRARFLQEFGGLSPEDLKKVSGVADAHFCHIAGFMAVAESKEGVLALIKKSL